MKISDLLGSFYLQNGKKPNFHNLGKFSKNQKIFDFYTQKFNILIWDFPKNTIIFDFCIQILVFSFLINSSIDQIKQKKFLIFQKIRVSFNIKVKASPRVKNNHRKR